MKFDEIIAKYGMIIVLMIVLGIIGIALFLWKKDDDSKEAKMIATAGVAMAATGLFIGLGYIAYQTVQDNKSGAGAGTNGTTPPPNGGEDALPPEA